MADLANSNLRELRVLDLFCGCGGLSYGLSMDTFAGYKLKVVAGLDFNKASIETFQLNHPEAKAYCVDIRKADISKIVAEIGQIDVIVGGPSCQGFSTHGKRLADDPRNFLYKYYLQFVEKVKPRWSVIENVTGLLRYESGRFRDEIVGDLAQLGYAVSFAQLQAADYGVPQVRKRVFFVANRLGMPFVFPAPTHGPFSSEELPFSGNTLYPYVSLAEAIGDLPLIGSGCSESEAPSAYALPAFSDFQLWSRQRVNALTMHYGAPPPDQNLHRIRHIPPGGDWLDIPSALLPERFSRILRKDCTTLYYRLRWDRPGYTITTVYRNVSSGAFTHPDEDRALTHREAARIQSFPDSFRFSRNTIPQQIGNAVPPLLARSLGIALLVHEQARHEGLEPHALERAVNEAVRAAAVPAKAELKVSVGKRQGKRSAKSIAGMGWDLIGSQVDPRAVFTFLEGTQSARFHTIAREEYPMALAALRLEQAVNALGRDCQPITLPKIDLSKFSAKQPARRRARAWTTHHFATVRYVTDPETGCSDVSQPLTLKLG